MTRSSETLLKFFSLSATFLYQLQDHRRIDPMQPFKLGLATIILTLVAFPATAQSVGAAQNQIPNAPGSTLQNPSASTSTQNEEQAEPGKPVPAGTTQPRSDRARATDPTPLFGTEYFVTLPKGHAAQSFAAVASQAAGFPVYVVREVDEKHALFAIDQYRIADQLEHKLRDQGLSVQRLPSDRGTIMGRKPVPRILISSSDPKSHPSKFFILRHALATAANADTTTKHAAYRALAVQIWKKTAVPTTVFPSQKEGSIVLVPAAKALSRHLSKKIASFEGASAEPVRLVRPFRQIN